MANATLDLDEKLMAEACIPFIPGSSQNQLNGAKEIISISNIISPGQSITINAKNNITYAVLFTSGFGTNFNDTSGKNTPVVFCTYQYPMVLGVSSTFTLLPLYRIAAATNSNGNITGEARVLISTIFYHISGPAFYLMNIPGQPSLCANGLIAFF